MPGNKTRPRHHRAGGYPHVEIRKSTDLVGVAPGILTRAAARPANSSSQLRSVRRMEQGDRKLEFFTRMEQLKPIANAQFWWAILFPFRRIIGCAA
jgi:hypothetical protein